MSGFSSLALSDTDKDVTVDQAIGGMEEGRRISGPVSYSSKDIASEKHGSFANPVTDAHAHPFMQVTGNRGYMYINAGANGPQNAINRSGNQQTSGTLNASTGTNPAQAGSSIPQTVQTHTGVETTGSAAGTVQAVTQQTGGSANVGTQAGQTVTEHTSGLVNTGTQIGQTVPEQISGPVNVNTTGEVHGNGGNLIGGETSPVSVPAGPTTQEPSGTSGASNNPIVAVEANTNPTSASGTPNASVHTDTSGQLEDRQIVNAGVTGAVTGPTGTQVGSASEITGSNTVHSADVTTQPVTGTTGPTVPEQTGGSVATTGNQGYITGQAGTIEASSPTVNTPTSGIQEPSGTSGTSNNPIVGVEAGTNPESGTAPNASVHTDTSGQLEDRQIVGAGVTGAATGSTGAQVGSASEITGSNTVHNADVTTQPVTGNGGNLIGGETSTVNAPTGTTTQETSGTSSNPIVAVEANTNPTSGTPNASVHTDTSGQLEDRQIIGAGVAGTGSTGTQVGSASEITGSNTVHNADVTTQPVTGTTGQTVPEQAGTTATIPVSTSTQEPSGTSNNPIVAVEANTNPTSGTAPNASVHTDTSGQLEDRQIVGAGVTGTATGSSGTQVGSASEITGSNTVHNADVTTQPVTGTTGQTVPEQTGGSVATTNQGYITGQAGTTEASSPTVSVSLPTSGTQEPSGTSGTSNNPIVSVEAGTNPTSGTPNASVHTDTSGQLEDRQIVSAGVAGAGTGSSVTQVSSASETTGSNTVHNADVTTQPVTGTTGEAVPNTTEAQTGSGSSGTTTQEPSVISGASNNPIVAVEANTNPTSGTPNASVHTDTSGQLEDRQIVSAGVTGAGTGSSGTQVGSASDITGSNTVHNADVTTQPVTSTTGQTIPEQTGGSVATETGNQGYITGQAGTTETNPTGSISTGGAQEPSGTSGTSNNPIVSVEAGTNPAAGTPNASVHTDTSGQLEDRQIANAGVAGSGTGSSGTQVGSASEITGSNTVHNADVTTQPVAGTTGQTIPEQTGGTVATQAQEGSATDVTGQELVQEADVTTEQAATGTGQTVPEQISAGSGTTTQEPSGTSGSPIVGVETGTNPESATPNVGASVDTTGELEDKQFLQTDLASEGITSSGQVGSASDTTGSSVVHGSDITTQPVASTTGQAITGTTTEAQTGSSSSGTTTQGQSGGSNNPIVAVNTNVNPASGTPNAGVQVNTSGQLEDRQIVDAGVAGPGAGSSGTQVGSASRKSLDQGLLEGLRCNGPACPE